MISKEISKWLNIQRKKQYLIVKKVDLSNLKNWEFNKKKFTT